MILLKKPMCERRDARIEQLYNISPIENVPSILEHGLYSYNLIGNSSHIDIALPEVQDRRDRIIIPNGRPLHDYANLYISVRNPMMFKRKDEVNHICVLKINVEVLDIDNVVISDRNASSNYCRYFNVEEGLKRLDYRKIFAQDWRHYGNPPAYYEHKSIKCAEVLIPDSIPPNLIMGAYVGNDIAKKTLSKSCPDIEIVINKHMFFEEV